MDDLSSRLAAHGPQLSYLYQEVGRLRQLSARRPIDLVRYVEDVKGCHRYLSIEAIGGEDLGRHIPLWDVYVPQDVRESLPALEFVHEPDISYEGIADDDVGGVRRFSQDGRRSYVEIQKRSVEEVLADSTARLVVILGDPGSGKSTLLHHVLMSWVRAQAGPLPVLVELRSYVSDQVQTDLIAHLAESDASIHAFGPTFEDYLWVNDSVILLDGLDEVVDAQRRTRLVNEIRQLSTRFPRARIILTSRIGGYRKEALAQAGFRHFTLQEFTDEQVNQFIDKWHDVAYADRSKAEHLKSRLKTAVVLLWSRCLTKIQSVVSIETFCSPPDASNRSRALVDPSALSARY